MKRRRQKKGISLMGDIAGAVYGAIPGAGWYGDYIAMSVSMSMEPLGTIEKLAHTRDSMENEFGRNKEGGINDPDNYSASKGGSKVLSVHTKSNESKNCLWHSRK